MLQNICNFFIKYSSSNNVRKLYSYLRNFSRFENRDAEVKNNESSCKYFPEFMYFEEKTRIYMCTFVCVSAYTVVHVLGSRSLTSNAFTRPG